MGEIIAVASGKGGTGKTSLCAGLGCALAQRGQNVLCVDMDVGLRNLDIALAMAEEPALAFSEASADRPLRDQAARHPRFGNLWLFTAPALRDPEELDGAHFADLMARARQEFDFVFLDAPAGLGEAFRLSARESSRVLLVCGSDPASLRDAARTTEVLELMGRTRCSLIVNRLNEKLIDKMHLTVDDVMDGAGLPLMGVVPEDRNVPLAAVFGTPLLLYGKRGACAACRRIARRLLGDRVPIPNRL